MQRQYKSVTHDPKSDKPEIKIYEGIDRNSSGATHQIVMGESGRFYCDDIIVGLNAIEQYCKDHYGWNTFQCPIQVIRWN